MEFGATLYVQQAYRTLQVEDIRGTRGLKDGSTQFEPGTLTKSLLDDNGWYFLDEINMADAGILSLLNNLLDGAGEITIPETGEKVVRKASWRFFAACNAGYHGTQELNQALVSRCVLVECEEFPPGVESEILRRNFPALAQRADDIALVAMAVREARANGVHEFDMCLRTCFQLAEEFLASGDLREAFRLTVLPKIGDRLTFGPVRDGLERAVDLLL
jgi:MoxR-like ATPase